MIDSSMMNLYLISSTYHLHVKKMWYIFHITNEKLEIWKFGNLKCHIIYLNKFGKSVATKYDIFYIMPTISSESQNNTSYGINVFKLRYIDTYTLNRFTKSVTIYVTNCPH